MGRQNKGRIFAVLGAASGLGNAVRFPAMCMEYGGCFILAYAAVLIAIAFPLLCAEFRFGMYGGRGGKLLRWAGCAATVNSALIALYYGYPSLSLCLSALSRFAQGGTGLKAVCAAAVWGGVFALLLSGERGLSKVARVTVIAPAVLFLLIAARSHGGREWEVSFNFPILLRGGIWADALGQAILSLSLATGVMPTFAHTFRRGISPVRLAFVVVSVNFAGGIFSSLAILPYAENCAFGAGISSALSAYSAVISASFWEGAAGNAFAFLFFSSLTLVAVQSCASLALPLVGRFSHKGKAVFCAAGLILTPLFCADGGAVYGAVDRAACTLSAPVIAFLECLSFISVFPRRNAKAVFVALSVAFGTFALFSLCGARIFAYPYPLSVLSLLTSLCVLLSGGLKKVAKHVKYMLIYTYVKFLKG